MSERWVDVSHEALIRGWPRLRSWIEEDRAGLRLHRRLTEAAQEWHKSRDESALYRGARLAQAVEWRERNAPSLNELERTFLDASLALQQHEVSVREQRRRRVIFGLSAALVLFAVLAGLALLQSRQAYKQGQIALARQLGAQADLLRDKPEMLFRRLLLATEAMKRLHAVGAEAPEVELVLRPALALLPRHIARFNAMDITGFKEFQALGAGFVGFSPDGRYLIVGDGRRGRVREIATGKELVRFDGWGKELMATLPGEKVVDFQMAGNAVDDDMLALSADGRYFVTDADMEREGIVQVWETDTGNELLHLQLPGESRHYAMSPDGRYLAVSTPTEITGSWNASARRQFHETAMSAEGRHFSDSTSTAITRVWDVHARREIPGSAPGTVHAFSQDATVVATSRGLWEVAAELKEVFSWETGTTNMVLSGDGGHVAIWTKRAGEKQIEVWSRAAKKMMASLPTPGPVGYLQAVTSDGRFVILSNSDLSEVQVHDVAAKEIVSRAPLLVRAAVVTPSGQYLIASFHSAQGENHEYDAMDVWELRREGGDVLAIDHEDKVIAVGLSLGGLTTIAQNGEKLIIRAWDVRARRGLPERRAEVTGTNAVFAPDDQSFAVMGDGGVEVRRVDQPEPVAKFAYASPECVIWSPDGRYLAAQKDQDVRVWDLNTRQSIGQLALPGRPTEIKLTWGGDSLAAMIPSAESESTFYTKLWKVASGEEVKWTDMSDEMRDVTRVMRGADCMSDEVTIVGIPADGIAKAEDERFVALDQESGYLVTKSDRNTVRVWLLRQEDLIEEACRRLPRNLSEKEWRDYVRDDAYRKTCPKLP
jgi:WD40 repeat protein